MNLESIFHYSVLLTIIGWLILVLTPNRRSLLMWGPRLIIPIVIAFLYSYLSLSNMGQSQSDYTTLANVALTFENKTILLAGWLHYLAFDLLIGVYVADKMDRNSIHRLIQAPILTLIFLSGPMGLLVAMLSFIARGNVLELISNSR